MTESSVRTDRRAERHLETRGRIIETAWALARERGLAGWSLRDVAESVGMRAPSLYVYFDSKNTPCTTPFSRTVIAACWPVSRRPRPMVNRRWCCVELPTCRSISACNQHQLLFLRTIPGFSPSAESYALALAVLEKLTEVLRAAGVGSPEQVDLWTALFTGMATQQISNDPGGDRWYRLIDDAVTLLTTPAEPYGSAEVLRFALRTFSE